jgi:hypothetical protein
VRGGIEGAISLPRPLLGAVINANDCQPLFIIMAFDPIYDNVRQSRHQHFPRTGLSTFMAHARKLQQEVDCLPDAGANALGSFRILRLKRWLPYAEWLAARIAASQAKLFPHPDDVLVARKFTPVG